MIGGCWTGTTVSTALFAGDTRQEYTSVTQNDKMARAYRETFGAGFARPKEPELLRRKANEVMSVRIRPITPADEDAVRELLKRLGVFESHEVRVAEEVLAESIAGSPDYAVHVAEPTGDDVQARSVAGYVCYGHNPVTDALYDVYWIAVDPAMQGRGVGRALLSRAEERVREAGGRGLVIDTSGRSEYEPARRLYERCGYRRVAEIPDYYKPGDGLVIYMKLL